MNNITTTKKIISEWSDRNKGIQFDFCVHTDYLEAKCGKCENPIMTTIDKIIISNNRSYLCFSCNRCGNESYIKLLLNGAHIKVVDDEIPQTFTLENHEGIQPNGIVILKKNDIGFNNIWNELKRIEKPLVLFKRNYNIVKYRKAFKLVKQYSKNETFRLC